MGMPTLLSWLSFQLFISVQGTVSELGDPTPHLAPLSEQSVLEMVSLTPFAPPACACAHSLSLSQIDQSLKKIAESHQENCHLGLSVGHVFLICYLLALCKENPQKVGSSVFSYK